MVPPQKATWAPEIVTGSGALGDDTAVGGFDPHGAAFKDAALAEARIRGEYNALPIGRDAGLEVA
jgi:hypothetical protein